MASAMPAGDGGLSELPTPPPAIRPPEAAPAPAPPATAAPGSSSVRLPDGHDTNDNAADFSVSATPTPGAANH
jgi:hypothetical protein